MKTIWIFAVALAVSGWCLPSAQAAKGDRSNKIKKPRQENAFFKYDRNGDGVLDESEKEAIRRALAKDPLLKEFDLNFDGKLEDHEIASIRPPQTTSKGGGVKKSKK